MTDFVDVKLRITKEVQEKIEYLGSQCDLSGDQMASAMFILHFHFVQDKIKEQVSKESNAIGEV